MRKAGYNRTRFHRGERHNDVSRALGSLGDKAMLGLFSFPVDLVWLAVAFIAVMATMLAAAPE